MNDLSWPLMFSGKYELARRQNRKALELDPSFTFAQVGLGWADIQEGKFGEAILEIAKAWAMDQTPIFGGWLGYAYGAAGERAKAESMLAELKRMSSQRFVSPFCLALVYLGLGDNQRALDEMEKAYEVRSQMLTFLKVDKTYDSLRSEPRFIELLKKVHLDK